MIGIGSDHAGYHLKKVIVDYFKEKNIEYKDFGTDSTDSVDFPDYARLVSNAVTDGICEEGILICGSGIGMSIAANKFPGIRAALCPNVQYAKLSKEHNNSNILILAGRMTDDDLAVKILETWLNTEFIGGKYENRNKLIDNYVIREEQ